MANEPRHPTAEEEAVAEAIPGVLTSLAERFREETRQSPLYRELAAQPTMSRRLRLAHSKIEEVVLTLTDVLRDVDDIEITTEKYRLIQGLPRAKSEAEQHFRDTEGIAGCVDKAFNSIHAALLNVQTEQAGSEAHGQDDGEDA